MKCKKKPICTLHLIEVIRSSLTFKIHNSRHNYNASSKLPIISKSMIYIAQYWGNKWINLCFRCCSMDLHRLSLSEAYCSLKCWKNRLQSLIRILF